MMVCTGVSPWIVLDLLQWKTQWLFTYIRSGSVSHYFPVGSQKLCLSRTGFVYVKNWKNSENSSISQLCFLSVIYLRFIITLVKGMFDLQSYILMTWNIEFVVLNYWLVMYFHNIFVDKVFSVTWSLNIMNHWGYSWLFRILSINTVYYS